MKLNKLEATFFEQVLNAELGVPVQATLEYEEETFEVILVPELNEDGQFVLNYFNAPGYEPETQFNEAGVGTRSFTDDQAFGRHPSLKRAWLSSDTVTLQMRPSHLPFRRASNRKLKASVLYAGLHHRGMVGLERNQVTLEQSPLQRAEFSLVGFPDFVLPSIPFNSTIDLSTQEREFLQSLAGRMGDNASISIRPPYRFITLDSKNGWIVELIRDEQPNRDMVGHTGHIERTDGQVFGSDELGDVLDVLKYFLAFVAGGYRHPTVNRRVRSTESASVGRNRPVLYFLSPHLELVQQQQYSSCEYGSGKFVPNVLDYVVEPQGRDSCCAGMLCA